MKQDSQMKKQLNSINRIIKEEGLRHEGVVRCDGEFCVTIYGELTPNDKRKSNVHIHTVMYGEDLTTLGNTIKSFLSDQKK